MQDQNTFSLLPADLHIRLQDIIFPEKSKHMNKSTLLDPKTRLQRFFVAREYIFLKY